MSCPTLFPSYRGVLVKLPLFTAVPLLTPSFGSTPLNSGLRNLAGRNIETSLYHMVHKTFRHIVTDRDRNIQTNRWSADGQNCYSSSVCLKTRPMLNKTQSISMQHIKPWNTVTFQRVDLTKIRIWRSLVSRLNPRSRTISTSRIRVPTWCPRSASL